MRGIWLGLVLAGLWCGGVGAATIANSIGASRLVQLWAFGLARQSDELSVIQSDNLAETLKELEAGKVDAVVVRQTAEQLAELPEQFHFEPVAYAAMAIYVHGNKILDNLTREQLRGVFTGVLTDWSSLTGEQYELHRYGIKEGAYGMPDFRKMLVGEEALAAVMFRVDTTAELLILINGTPNGIGFGWYGANLPPGAEPVAIEGVKPDAGVIRTGEYPLRWEIGLVTRKGDEEWLERAQDFARELERPEAIEWCNAEGWVPLTPTPPSPQLK